jgi:hypothetical protein
LLVVGVNFIVNNLLLSGRIIALVSFVAVGILAAAATRRFGGDRVDAVLGGSCALGFGYLVAPSWVAADDPQTLAEALTLGGLVSYISRPPDRISLLRTAVLVTLGGFAKHNVVQSHSRSRSIWRSARPAGCLSGSAAAPVLP